MVSIVLLLFHTIQSGIPSFLLSSRSIFFLVVPAWRGPLQERDGFLSLKLTASERRSELAWVTEPECLADIKQTGHPVPTASPSFPWPPPPPLLYPLTTHPHQTWTFSESVIKTRQGATETSCLGYRRAAGVKGDVRSEPPLWGGMCSRWTVPKLCWGWEHEIEKTVWWAWWANLHCDKNSGWTKCVHMIQYSMYTDLWRHYLNCTIKVPIEGWHCLVAEE